MRPSELEAWVISITERVLAGKPHEDARVELKAEWPEPDKAARQLAGQANSAGGEPILWLIGLDERAGIQQLLRTNLATWYPQVSAEFNGIAPGVQDLVVPTQKGPIVALLFDASRIPYVVRNLVHGQLSGGPVAFEVPWREGTAVRTATRADLIRLLMPLQSLPEVETLEGALRLSVPLGQDRKTSGMLHVKFYFVPPYLQRVVIPFHRCNICIQSPLHSEFRDIPLALRPPQSYTASSNSFLNPKTNSVTMEGTATEIVIDGPGVAYLNSQFEFDGQILDLGEDVRVVMTLRPVHASLDLKVDVILTKSAPDNPNQLLWKHPNAI